MTDELREQVNISVSSLLEGYQVTPLREFTGVFDNYEAARDERYDRVRVALQFTDVEVVESTEPYPFPIAQLTVPFSQRRRSQMGFLVASIDKIIPGGSLSSLLKKRVRMKMIAENFGRWRGEEEDRIMACWEVIELFETEEASQSKTSYQAALELAVGKSPDSLKDFYQEAFKNPAVKADRGLVGKILNKTFISEALEAGDLKVGDDGLLALPVAEA